MEFYKISIYTNSGQLEPLADKLVDMGASGFEFHDAADFEEFLASGKQHWDYIGEECAPLRTQETHLTFYLTTDSQGNELLASVKSKFGGFRIEVGTVREEDWEENWKQYFKPFPVGRRLLIKPTWEPIPENLEGRLVLEIDPASAFGTGQHESTKMCLETLEGTIKSGDTFCDLGCGSGILTIAALLLGAKNAVMVDVSENAVKTASGNVKQNDFTEFAAYCADAADGNRLLECMGTGFDIIAANIVADVLIKLAGIIPRLLKQGGMLIASGIIGERCDEAAGAFKDAGLSINEIKHDNGWCMIACVCTEQA